jgi:hypothetical protein
MPEDTPEPIHASTGEEGRGEDRRPRPHGASGALRGASRGQPGHGASRRPTSGSRSSSTRGSRAATISTKAAFSWSATMSELTHKADTAAENELQNLISSIRPLVSAKFNERFPIERRRRSGFAYLADAIIDDFLILEAEGKDSASADNEKRDEALRTQGKESHLPTSLWSR